MGIYYKIYCQERRWVKRGNERFWEAYGSPWKLMPIFRTKREARQEMMRLIRTREYNNKFEPYFFYWIKKLGEN